MVEVILLASLALATPLEDDLVDVGLTVPAYVEALRAAHEGPEDARAAATFDAGGLLLDGGELDLASRHFRARLPDPSASLALSFTLLRQRAHGSAAQQALSIAAPGSAYLAGWAYVEAFDWPAAVASLESVPTGSPLQPTAAQLRERLLGIRTVAWRSPGLAGVMSAVVPGSGQAYSGRWGEALSALLIVGGLGFTTYELARRELYLGSVAVGLFAFGFYGGNVMSAVNGARLFNRRHRRERVQSLAPEFRPNLEIEGGQATVSVGSGGAPAR